MPARFLLVSMLITVAPDILFMLTFAKTDAHQKRVLVAKQSGKQHVALHEWEKKVGKYKEGVTVSNSFFLHLIISSYVGDECISWESWFIAMVKSDFQGPCLLSIGKVYPRFLLLCFLQLGFASTVQSAFINCPL